MVGDLSEQAHSQLIGDWRVGPIIPYKLSVFFSIPVLDGDEALVKGGLERRG